MISKLFPLGFEYKKHNIDCDAVSESWNNLI